MRLIRLKYDIECIEDCEQMMQKITKDSVQSLKNCNPV